MTLKNRLKEIRLKEYMMTSSDFAKKIGVSLTTYSNWELDKAKPTLETAFQVAEILNKNLEDIWYQEK